MLCVPVVVCPFPFASLPVCCAPCLSFACAQVLSSSSSPRRTLAVLALWRFGVWGCFGVGFLFCACLLRLLVALVFVLPPHCTPASSLTFGSALVLCPASGHRFLSLSLSLSLSRSHVPSSCACSLSLSLSLPLSLSSLSPVSLSLSLSPSGARDPSLPP